MAILKKLREKKRKNNKTLKVETKMDGETAKMKLKKRKDGSVKKIVTKVKRNNSANNLRKVEKYDKKGKKKKEVTYFRGKRNVTKVKKM